MKITTKLILLICTGVALVTTSLTCISSYRMHMLANNNLDRYQASMMANYDQMIKDQVIGVCSVLKVLEELANTAKSDGRLKETTSYMQRAYLVHLSSGRLLQAKTAQEKSGEIFELLNDKINVDKSRAAALLISNQLKAGSSETTKPSKSP